MLDALSSAQDRRFGTVSKESCPHPLAAWPGFPPTTANFRLHFARILLAVCYFGRRSTSL
jgi:hypothetical protein